MFKSLYDPYQMWKIPPLPLLVAFKEKGPHLLHTPVHTDYFKGCREHFWSYCIRQLVLSLSAKCIQQR